MSNFKAESSNKIQGPMDIRERIGTKTFDIDLALGF
jgi:hypothetical protein